MTDIRAAIVKTIEDLQVPVGEPISLYAIGPTLVGMGFDELAIVDTLYGLQEAKIIELMDGNRLRVLPLSRR